MKELVKPIILADNYKLIEEYSECGRHCDTHDTFNKHCDGGSTNKAPINDDEILF
jgi:hypothetical protein